MQCYLQCYLLAGEAGAGRLKPGPCPQPDGRPEGGLDEDTEVRPGKLRNGRECEENL